MKVKCTFCDQPVDEVNDCGVCKGCWCPEGEKQWEVSEQAKKEMIEYQGENNESSR